MGQRFYRALRGIVHAFSHKMETRWTVPFDGDPCVFVVNHAGAFGPIDMCAHFELRDEIRPWYNHDVAEPKLVPAYVRQDYWWKPGCALEPLFNVTLPYIAAAVLPPIIRSVPGIPVYHDTRVIITMRQSMRALRDGHHVVIFPEQPSGWRSHHTWINTGFLQLGVLYHKATGQNLKFWPIHLDHRGHVFEVAAPLTLDPDRSVDEQKDAFSAALAVGFRGGATALAEQ